MLWRIQNYSFSLFCMKNSFVSKDVVVEVDVANRKVPISYSLKTSRANGTKAEQFFKDKNTWQQIKIT